MVAAEKQLSKAVRSGRVIIEGVSPEIDAGKFPIKRVIGDEVSVQADVFIEGHEALSCSVLYRRKGSTRWTEVPMRPLVNDRWEASFLVEETGRYQYTIEGWADPFKSWRRDLEKRIAADQDITVDLLIGADIVESTALNASSREATRIRRYVAMLRGEDPVLARSTALDLKLFELVAAHIDRSRATRYEHELEVVVDIERAAFSSWYELFPRSTAAQPGTHGTFRDVEQWLPRIADLGFDVLYLPPIHPIGLTHRKGRNNALNAQASDFGSPWAIGGKEGGHKGIHPLLGTVDDFRKLVKRAGTLGIDIALDIAFQASPDHPYVREHPEWFRQRPDGTIQYAENPPKKYQDIYPFDFESADAEGLWRELRSVFEYWIEQGIRIFRVDNPHTKPFPFWEWLIAKIKQNEPEVLFLSEAFTRPKVMYRLAKLGFSQSYTYFAWRNAKREITEYFTELTTPPVVDFFRPNLWPNTPDILTEPFVKHGKPVFMSRLVLAGTLGANYGIYGPAYETMDATPREPGSEEYLNSEKYEVKHWNFEAQPTVTDLIKRVNRIRKENPALQRDRLLEFHRIENEHILAYTKRTPDLRNVILTVVNLDPSWTHSGWVELPLEKLGLPLDGPFEAHDLLTGHSYMWNGAWNYVELNPLLSPAHILRLRPLGE
jgi:starch synthase (maltosyl-transferring)